jgi:hypothetical protein
MSDVELFGQPSAQLCLLGKAVPGVLLLLKKLGLLLATRHEGLQKRHKLEAQKQETKARSVEMTYLAN